MSVFQHLGVPFSDLHSLPDARQRTVVMPANGHNEVVNAVALPVDHQLGDHLNNSPRDSPTCSCDYHWMTDTTGVLALASSQ